jgi:hypothetical protein
MGKALKSGLIYFGAVFAVAFALGALRTLFIAPRIGSLWAVLIEVPVLLTIAWVILGRIQARYPLTIGQAAVAGAFAFALLMGAEVALSAFLAGRSFSEHLALYARLPEQIGLAGQIGFGLLPMLRVVRR